MDAEVLVVGAGPVGLTAACQLARLGVRVRVVDRLAEPTTESRAVGVHARSLELLAALGVLDRLEARGRRMGALEMLDGRTGETRMRLDLGDAPTLHPYLLDVPQPDTEAVLAERAAELGVVVERGVELTALTQDPDGVTVRLGQETARFAWVLGADGGHSATRHLVGAHLEGGFHGQHFAMADVDVDTSFPPDAVRMFSHPDGMGMLFPLRGDRARIMFQVADPGAGDPTLEQVQALADARTGGRVTLRDPRWLTYFEIHHAQVPQYRYGRVFLAGDAAHVHSPAAAQGMNTGIQDADNLAWKLALVVRHGADPALLDSYHTERHPVGAEVVRTTTLMTNVATGSGAASVLRDTAMFVLGHTHRVADAAAARMAELRIRYRDSALAVEHGRAVGIGAVRAGDHAPDTVTTAGGPVAVETLLQTPGLLLLADRTGPVEVLVDLLGDLGTVVPVVGPGMSLVRPDGYLGLVGDTADPRRLRSYLDDVLRLGSRV
jgi:2-polyprenyl-6-methoxyphenol hydroxylase-like FAD-dependent oxidoreductase